MDEEEIAKLAGDAANVMGHLVHLPRAKELLARTAAGDPCQLDQPQAQALLWALELMASMNKKERG